MARQGLQQIQGLHLQQVLAPQLQQSLQILQAPTLELRSLVQAELESNPVLEEGPPEEEPQSKESDEDFREEFERLAQLDEDWRDQYSNGSGTRTPEDDEKRQHFFDSIPVEETLQQHLLDQLSTADLAPNHRKIAELIIGNIDETGYLQSDIPEMSMNSGVPEAHLEEVLKVLQSFHPPGVAARSLQECLLLQLEREGKEQTLEYRIVSKYLEELGKHRYPEIARRAGTTVDQVQKAALAIACLDPKPGLLYSPQVNSYVLPDASVEKVGDDYVVMLNNEQIPHLRISKTYKDIMASGEGKSEVSDYIRDKIRGGKFLIKSIHQRQQTILNIINELLKRQRDFFDFGPSFLRPLTMVQVALEVGVHETTVSRAIFGKYLDTPHGVFELKYFFTPGYETADGGTMSNTSVKEAIGDLVKSEDSMSPLSDQEIVDILQKQGVNIARRTVAKYRGELNILPSNLRKRY